MATPGGNNKILNPKKPHKKKIVGGNLNHRNINSSVAEKYKKVCRRTNVPGNILVSVLSYFSGEKCEECSRSTLIHETRSLLGVRPWQRVWLQLK